MNSIIFIGMDVHSTNFTFCALEPAFGKEDKIFGVVKTTPDYRQVIKYIDKLKKELGDGYDFICGYEAGCLGYTLHDQLSQNDIKCIILAPSTMSQPKNRRVKTDKRDAKMIATCLAYGTYSAVYIPDRTDIQIKEYIRMRDDHKDSLKRIKQQIKAFCLRNGKRYEGNTAWTAAYVSWLRKLELCSVLREALDDYLATYDSLTDKIERMDKRIEEFAMQERYAEDVKKLVCLLGIKTHTALSLIVETGDFRRFRKGNTYAAFLGLAPGEDSSGDDVNRTSITKAGNRHLRRLLVESAQGYCKGKPGFKSKNLKARQSGNPAGVIAYADKANDRLRRKYRRMTAGGKKANVAKTAVARELACFVWGMMTGNITKEVEME